MVALVVGVRSSLCDQQPDERLRILKLSLSKKNEKNYILNSFDSFLTTATLNWLDFASVRDRVSQ
jgi:hypothetical protein